MADGGYLVTPSENEKPSEIWEETWKRVDRFLPNLFSEVFPESKAPPPMDKHKWQEQQGDERELERNGPSSEVDTQETGQTRPEI